MLNPMASIPITIERMVPFKNALGEPSDPEMVVLGGPLVHEGGVLVDAVRREARLRALPHISRALRIACDDQGAMAGARGAAFLALDAIFAPDGMAF
jgi:hypothetical protein